MGIRIVKHQRRNRWALKAEAENLKKRCKRSLGVARTPTRGEAPRERPIFVKLSVPNGLSAGCQVNTLTQRSVPQRVGQALGEAAQERAQDLGQPRRANNQPAWKYSLLVWRRLGLWLREECSQECDGEWWALSSLELGKLLRIAETLSSQHIIKTLMDVVRLLVFTSNSSMFYSFSTDGKGDR